MRGETESKSCVWYPSIGSSWVSPLRRTSADKFSDPRAERVGWVEGGSSALPFVTGCWKMSALFACTALNSSPTDYPPLLAGLYGLMRNENAVLSSSKFFFFVFSILYCKKKNGIKHFETGTLLEIFSILYIVCIGSEFHREVGSWWIRFKLCEIPRRWIAGGSDAHVNWLVWLIFSKGLRLIDDLKWELCWGTNKLNYRGSDDFENWSSWWIRFKLSECVVYFALSHLSVKLIQRIWSLWPFCGLAVGTGVVVSFILFFCFHFFSFLFFFF